MRSRRDFDHHARALIVRERRPGDDPALRRLAQLDTARVPAGRLVVASDGPELVAAVRVADGTAIANPFRHTAEAVEVLRARARQLRRGEKRSSGGLAARLARMRPGWSSASGSAARGMESGSPTRPTAPGPRWSARHTG